MRPRERALAERLADERSGRVVMVSHCLLNENTRYLGGAFHPGAVPEMTDLLRGGAGIHQMPCPERCAWGGVLKPWMLRAYGLDRTPLRAVRRPLLRLFVGWTRLRYRLLARAVARDIAGYRSAGVAVVGVVGVGASPSCGVTTTLDLPSAFLAAARQPPSAVDRTTVNRDVVRGCRVAGQGLFIAALRRELERRRIEVPFVEYDLIAEMDGRRQDELF